MQEAVVEYVDTVQRRLALRWVDSSSCCVVALLGRHVPGRGERLRVRLQDGSGGYLVGANGETAAVSVLRRHCSLEEAQRLLGG